MNYVTDAIGGGRFLAISWRSRLAIFIVLMVGLGVFVYHDALSGLLSAVLHRQGSSHGVFVPFLSGYFLWLKRDNIRRSALNFSLLSGGALVMAGFLIQHASRGTTEVVLPSLSLMMVMCGLVITLFGVSLFKEVCFPLLFLGTVVPIPETIYNQIAEAMRAVTTDGSIWLMHLINLPIHRENYIVQLPEISLSVDLLCSGIRYLLSFFVFSLAYAFLFKKSLKSRMLVVFCSLPVAIVAGTLRLSTIYLSIYYIGSFMAGRPHIWMSRFLFLAVLMSVVSLDQYLAGIWSKRSGVRAEGVKSRV